LCRYVADANVLYNLRLRPDVLHARARVPGFRHKGRLIFFAQRYLSVWYPHMFVWMCTNGLRLLMRRRERMPKGMLAPVEMLLFQVGSSAVHICVFFYYEVHKFSATRCSVETDELVLLNRRLERHAICCFISRSYHWLDTAEERPSR
jgi:hypothetical protein